MKQNTARYNGHVLRGLSWYGGKSAGRHGGAVSWINALLPHRYRQCYIEPYAGMLGVLLSRPRSQIEIVNDLNGRLVNWWLCVRDRTDEFARKLRYTPHSERLFHESLGLLDDPDPLTRAVAFHNIILNSRTYSDPDNLAKSHFAISYSSTGRCDTAGRFVEQIDAIADRLRRVVILERDATQLLDRVKHRDNVLIYSDPPYRDAKGSNYAVMDGGDRDTLLELYAAQRGRVAISGYGDEWDALGWERNEFQTSATMCNTAEGDAPKRTEVLWTNFPAMTRSLLLHSEVNGNGAAH